MTPVLALSVGEPSEAFLEPWLLTDARLDLEASARSWAVWGESDEYGLGASRAEEVGGGGWRPAGFDGGPNVEEQEECREKELSLPSASWIDGSDCLWVCEGGGFSFSSIVRSTEK